MVVSAEGEDGKQADEADEELRGECESSHDVMDFSSHVDKGEEVVQSMPDQLDGNHLAEKYGFEPKLKQLEGVRELGKNRLGKDSQFNELQAKPNDREGANPIGMEHYQAAEVGG
eukprot:9866686-Alexandrium_andersonii.AAC.1